MSTVNAVCPISVKLAIRGERGLEGRRDLLKASPAQAQDDCSFAPVVGVKELTRANNPNKWMEDSTMEGNSIVASVVMLVYYTAGNTSNTILFRIRSRNNFSTISSPLNQLPIKHLSKIQYYKIEKTQSRSNLYQYQLLVLTKRVTYTIFHNTIMELEFIICSIYIRQVKLYIIPKHKGG